MADDNGKTQAEIDRDNNVNQSTDDLVKAEVSAPISESQVQPGREVVDGNGLRETPNVEPVRPDVIVDKDIVTQSKLDALDDKEREHARRVQSEQAAKLNQNTRPSEDAK